MIYNVRQGFSKKVAVLLDFVQMRGGEGPAQIFGTLAFKKVAQVVQIRRRGGGVELIWTKSKRTATFSGDRP